MTSQLTRRQFGLAALAAGASTGAQATTLAKTSLASTSRSNLQRLYLESDASDLARLVRNRDVSAEELLEEAIRRTEELNPVINAVTLKHYDAAKQAIKRGLPEGAFTGVPFLLKDLGVKLQGTVTTGGSNLLKGVVAPQDDALVTRHKRAGAVIFGKTNTPEFGMALTTESYLHGPCRNPWNLEHSTGGSSGGSAAAVAAGIVPMAHATDGGGSIRVPASACGIFGFKPTRALTPRGGSPSMMSVSHVVSRSVRDSASMLDQTAGYEPGLPFVSPEPVGGYVSAIARPPRKLRVAVVLDEPNLKVDEDVLAAVNKVAKTLESLGHIVEPVSPGVDFDNLNRAQNALLVPEFSNGMQSLAKAVGRPLDHTTLEKASLMFVETGKQSSASDYLDAWYHIQAVTQKMAVFHQSWDVVLSPVTVTPAPLLGTITEREGDTVESYTERFRTYSAYTPLQNLTGVPSASLPVGLSNEGLPVAALISAAIGQDALLLSLCRQLEVALPFESRRPPLA